MLFHKVGTDLSDQHRNHRAAEESNQDKERNGFVAQAPTEGFGILVVHPIEGAHYDTFVPTFFALFVVNQVAFVIDMYFARFEQLAGQHRCERYSHQRGGAHHNGYNPSQFLEHDAGHTRQCGQRHEYGHDNQRGGDNGYPYLVGGVDGCFARIFTTIDMLGNVFQYHNGIVHYHTDSHGERTHRDDVQRRACHLQVDECYDEGDRNGDADNQRGAPLAQEEQNDQHHEQQRV